MRERRRSADDDAEVPWEDVPAARSPRSPRAGVRFLGSARPARCPTGAPRGEAYRRPPDLDDWLVLLEDYALRCLRAAGAARPPTATPRSRAALARARLPAHPQGHPPRHVRGRPAADRLAGQGARARRGARRRDARRAATPCARSSCATPSWPTPAPRRRAHRRARPRRRHRPPRAAGDRRRRRAPRRCARCSSPAAGCAAAPSDADVLLEALKPGRGPLQAARVGGRAGRPARLAALLRAPSGCRARGWSWPRALLVERRHAARWSAPARCSARAGTARR